MQNRIELRNRGKRAVREFFEDGMYVEVETPTLVVSPDIEPTLTHVETSVNAVGNGSRDVALITSPEYACKKIVASGVSRVFEFARVFRNKEPLDSLHSIEFTMLEWYRMGASLEDGIKETIDLIERVVAEVAGQPVCTVHGKRIAIDEPHWDRLTVEELFAKYCGIESLTSPTRELYAEALERHSLSHEDEDSISDLFQRLFLNLVEPHIRASTRPTVVAYYPAHEATLARVNDNGLAERFEIYIGGIELCNGYGELTDGAEQRRRFVSELEERKRLGKSLFPIDEDLIEALGHINKPLFGNALGFDRLLMLASGEGTIKNVILFPSHEIFNRN